MCYNHATVTPLEIGYVLCVCILRSKQSGRWYTGFTSDLRKRFYEHSAGKSRSTNQRGPYEWICSEASTNEYDARSRELYLKSGMGKRYLKTRLKRFLSLTG